jgi:hypothetical protein
MYKIWRSSRSVYGDEICPDGIHGIETDETLSALQVYTENELKKIADAGFNAIWVHGLLRHLIRVEPFPELGECTDIQIDAMRSLIDRAAKYGIKVFIYMQPPRALPQSYKEFWDNHLDIWGDENICCAVPIRRFCTSSPKVKQWLKNAGAALAQNLPGLAGVIMITASEFPQHCYSHSRKSNPEIWANLLKCPRCREREPEDVVAELINLVRNGIRTVSSKMEIVAWNWSWAWNKDSNSRIIEKLQTDVILMADFERGGYTDLDRRPDFHMDEYSLSYAGPSEKCKTAYETAQKCGLRFMAKLQLGTTHELASVVTLPMVSSLYDKAVFHRNQNVSGYMGCWNFGNALPNSNVEAFNFFISAKCPDSRDAAMLKFAKQAFPDCKTELLLQAWNVFAQAMNYYPFTIAFLYHGPQNYTLAYKEIYQPAPLTGKPAGRSWKFDERGDDLSNSYKLHHTQFNLDEIIERVGKIAAVWQCGITIIEQAFAECNCKKSLDELGNSIICGAVWRSTENTYRIFKLRKNWNVSKNEEFFRILDDELCILKDVLPWVKRDPRQGFHIEPQGYMFNAESVAAKIAALEKLKLTDSRRLGKTVCNNGQKTNHRELYHEAYTG